MKMNTFNIIDFGAVGDGCTLNTKSIQDAVEAAAGQGGGRVVIPPGRFNSGTIFLRENITLEIQTGGVLLASRNIEDYPNYRAFDLAVRGQLGLNDIQSHAFLVTQCANNVMICGGGTIQLPGDAFWLGTSENSRGWIAAKKKRVSPSIVFRECEHVRMIDVSIFDSSGWTVEFNSCRYVWVRGVFIKNHFWGPNTDGLDIQGCQDVMISDCRIDVSDDCIVLKTLPDTLENARITVTNCTLRTQCVGLKLGAGECHKPMRQVVFSNCIVHDTTRAFGLYAYKKGAVYEDIIVSNIICDTKNEWELNRPIHIDVRDRDGYGFGTIRNVIISDFICRTDGRILITAQEGAVVENIVLRNIRMHYEKINDPEPLGRNAKSAQFSMANPDCAAARAVVAAENIKGFVLDGLYVDYPDDYQGVPFHVLWGRGLKGGMINAPLCASSVSTHEKYHLENSTIQVTA